jgi:hypothetical protein
MPYVATLNAADLDFGKQVTDRLKTSGFPFKGVFWLFDEAADDWQLVIVTNLVDEVGRRDTYLRLGRSIAGVPGYDFQSLKITVMSPQVPLYQALAATFGKTDNVEGVQLPRTVVNGIRVPGAYLYEIER